jgi:hypothetical protein
MFTKAAPSQSQRSRKSLTTKLARLAAGAAISLAFFTTAAPAMAQEYPSPDGSSGERTAPVVQDDTLDVSSATLGALAGIALAGVGLGISLGVHRHRDHQAAVPTI